ncbi:MAG: hypothetical protein H6727_09380 [Myxococcales bacterium]|nr:hypothetical protein [Myxococcales bacterium]
MWKFWAVVILLEALACFAVPFLASWLGKKLFGPRKVASIAKELEEGRHH